MYAGIGEGIGDAIGGLFGGSNARNPYDEAMPYARQYVDETRGFRNRLSPYMDLYGHSVRNLLGHPTDIMSQIMSRYHESPYARQLTQQAHEAADATAAHGGYVGTPEEQEAVAGKVGQIANTDEQQWMQNALGLYGQGLQGAGRLEGQIPQMFQQEGSGVGALSHLAARSADWQNRRRSNMWGGIGGAAGAAGAAAYHHFHPAQPGFSESRDYMR